MFDVWGSHKVSSFVNFLVFVPHRHWQIAGAYSMTQEEEKRSDHISGVQDKVGWKLWGLTIQLVPLEMLQFIPRQKHDQGHENYSSTKLDTTDLVPQVEQPMAVTLGF